MLKSVIYLRHVSLEEHLSYKHYVGIDFNILIPDAEAEATSSQRKSQDSGEFYRYEQFSRKELPARVRQALEKEVEYVMSETEKLISQLPEIVRVCQEQVFAIFRAQEASMDNDIRIIEQADAHVASKRQSESIHHTDQYPKDIESMFVEPPSACLNAALLQPGQPLWASSGQIPQLQASESIDEGCCCTAPISLETTFSFNSTMEPPALTCSATVPQSLDLDFVDEASQSNEMSYENLTAVDDNFCQRMCHQDDSGLKGLWEDAHPVLSGIQPSYAAGSMDL